MDEKAEILLRKRQDEFETEHGVNLGYGSYKQLAPDNRMIILRSQDGTYNIEGTGETDVAAVEDAFAKAEELILAQATSSEQESTQSKRGLDDAFDDSFAKSNRPTKGQSTSFEQEQEAQDGDERTSGSGIESGDDISGDDEITSAAPASTSPEQPQAQVGVSSAEAVAVGENVQVERETPSVEIEGLADFDLSDGVSLIFQQAAKITPANLITHRPRTKITTTMLLFVIYDLAGNLSQSTDPSQLDFPEPIKFLHRQVAGESFDKIRDNYFYPTSETNDTSEKPQDVSTSQTVESQPLSRLTTNVLNVLDFAKEIAHNTTGENTIRVRHLIGGLLSYEPETRPSGIQRRFEQLNLEVRQLRREYLRLIQNNFPNDNHQAWTIALLTREGEIGNYLAEYTADDAKGEKDFLGIDRDVNALAYLISAHVTVPPLAIGIFGDWGSGKTFFMRRLKWRINELSEKARKSGTSPYELGFFKNIVQIEFNAWHYVESNLWASMVEHIFANLRISDGDENTHIQERQNKLLDKLKAAKLFRDQAQAEKNHAETIRDQAKKKVEDIKTRQKTALDELAKKQLTSPAILEQIELSPEAQDQRKALAKEINFVETGQAALEFYGAVQEAQTVLSRGSALVVPLANARDRWWRFGFLLLIIFGSPLLGWGISELARLISPEVSAQLSPVTGWLTALLGTGAEWIRRQSAWVSNQLQKAEQAKQTLDKLIEEKRAEFDEQIAEAQLELAQLDAEYQVAVREQEEAERRVQIITGQLAEGTTEQLTRFIQERTQADDYRKHLGLLAMIRRDFQTLSDYIKNLNKEQLKPKKPKAKTEAASKPEDAAQAEAEVTSDSADASQEKTEEAQTSEDSAQEEQTMPDVGINRIILYIDDLDRCPPRKVVQVLQAVHLLLAFPLFVVVVGVDSRWVSYALMQRYKGLLRGRDTSSDNNNIRPEATPHDYLEKIFQIPLWLEPVDEEGTRGMLAGIIDNVVPDTPDVRVPTEDQPVAEAPPPISSDEETELSGPSPSAEDDITDVDEVESADEPAAEPTSSHLEPPEDLNPASLQIRQSELEFMQELSPILGRSPRSIKRFINVYRLIKVGLNEVELSLFFESQDGTPSDAHIVMLLLTILTGMPELSREIFKKIEDEYKSSPFTDPEPRLEDLLVLQREFTLID